MYRNILVPLDGSETAECGLVEAIGLARDAGARLVLLHVIDALPLMVEMAAAMNEAEVRRLLHEDADAILARAREAASRVGVEAEAMVKEIHSGGAAAAIVEAAQHVACDLIVIGTHGRRGLGRVLLGSTAEAVVHRADMPVLLVRARPPGRPVAEAPVAAASALS